MIIALIAISMIVNVVLVLRLTDRLVWWRRGIGMRILGAWAFLVFGEFAHHKIGMQIEGYNLFGWGIYKAPLIIWRYRTMWRRGNAMEENNHA